MFEKYFSEYCNEAEIRSHTKITLQKRLRLLQLNMSPARIGKYFRSRGVMPFPFVVRLKCCSFSVFWTEERGGEGEGGTF